MGDDIVITEGELRRSIARYEAAMSDLAMMLNDPKISSVGAAFSRWVDTRKEPWQVLYIEAKRYINTHGTPPWGGK